MPNQYTPGPPFASARTVVLECRCGRKHCSPSCEACRIYGVSRCEKAHLR